MMTTLSLANNGAKTGDPIYFPVTRRLLAFAWSRLAVTLSLIGQISLNLLLCLRYIVSGQISMLQGLQQCRAIGITPLPLALVMTAFIAMVIALQVAKEMSKQGTESFVGSLVALVMVRELAPIMTAFAVSALAGSGMAAELGAMSISQQLNALRMLRINPVRYCILPRFVAGCVMLPLMTIVTTVVSIVAGMLVSKAVAGVNYDIFMEAVINQTSYIDVFACLLKAGLFGGFIGLLSATIGVNTQGGAKSVGDSATNAVVGTFLGMALLDYLLTLLIYGLQH
jgi:phospholipid/cholesterol/gamma-HCH transport system permease protein